ncbi:hypothetical protein BH09BAC5_BH09BAC5_09420 [soil metagenome]
MKKYIQIFLFISACFFHSSMYAQYTGGSADGSSSFMASLVLGTGSIAAPTAINDTICTGNTATLTATAPGGNYFWYTVATGGTPIDSGASFTTPVLVSTTTYYVETVLSGCTSPRTAVVVIVNPLPVILLSPNTSICAGQSVNLTVSGGTQYSWTSNPVGFTSTQTAITISPSVTTTYYVIATSSQCSSNDSVTVTVNPLPVISLSNDSSICAGQTLNLLATGGTQYSWTSNPVGFTSTQSQVLVSPVVTTTYYVSVSNGMCSSVDSVIITINSPFTVTISGPSTTCSGQPVTLIATGGAQYNWSSNPIGFSSMSDTVQVTPTVNTVYYVSGTIGQCTSIDSFNISIAPAPVININSPSAVCTGASVTLNASGGQTYLWNTGGTTSTLTVNPTSTTTYSVTVTSSSNCSAIDSVTVQVVQPPVASIFGGTATCTGMATTLSASGGSSYLWSTGASTSSIQVAPTLTSTYTVIVSNGICSDSASVRVEILDEESTLYIPNVFTPNGDGINEMFSVGASGINNFQGMIYNRWGELLFTWNDFSSGWDGTYKGNLVSEGVYVYLITCYTDCNVAITRRGAVTVLR